MAFVSCLPIRARVQPTFSRSPRNGIHAPTRVLSARRVRMMSQQLGSDGIDDVTFWPLNSAVPTHDILDLTVEQRAEATAASGNPPSSNGGGGGGGSGGDDDGDGYEDILKQFGRTQSDLPTDISALRGADLRAYLSATKGGFGAWLARVWPGWRKRVAADAEFPFKVLMELTVGLGLAGSGMVAARGDRILQELDFAFCDIAVGGTLNFILVYLLTPAFGVVPKGMAAKLPANLFASGSYGVGERVAGFLYKGGLFAVCGFMGSVAGTTLTQGLLQMRKVVKKLRKDDSPEVEHELPNVLAMSAGWAGFMFASANPRYQSVAGIERVLFGGMVPEAAAKLLSAGLRTGNNVMGGASWVLWARAIGLQGTDGETGDAGKEQ